MSTLQILGDRFRDALCAQFNGTDESLYSDNPSIGSNTQGTIAMFWQPDSLLGANGARSIWAFADSGGSGEFIAMRQFRGATTGGQNRLQVIRAGGGVGNYHGNTQILSGVKYGITLVSNGSTWSIYVNGTLQSLTNISGSNTGDWLGDIAGANRVLRFAAQGAATPQNWCHCRINEAVYWDRALSGAEVSEWYNSGVPRNPHRLSSAADLAGWWRMGDSRDDATTIYDEIGSNNLTLVNMDASNYVAP